MVDDCRVFVRFEGRGYGEVGRGISVENVDELRLLHCTNHDRTAPRIDREVLSGHYATRTRFAKRFLVNFDKTARLGIIVKDDDTSGVRAYDGIV
jgi:hypothetical protein